MAEESSAPTKGDLLHIEYKRELRELVESTIQHLEHVETFEEFQNFLAEQTNVATLKYSILQFKAAAL